MSKKFEQRINGLIQSHLSTLIDSGMNDPRVTGVTLTDVEITPDTRYAKVYFSVWGDEKSIQDASKGLQGAAGWLGRELGRRLHTKNTPHLTFIYDGSLVRGERMAQLLDQLKTSEANAAPAPEQPQPPEAVDPKPAE